MISIQSSNYDIKFAGSIVTIKQYSKGNVFGYKKKSNYNKHLKLKPNNQEIIKFIECHKNSSIDNHIANRLTRCKEKEKVTKEQFEKSSIRARMKLFDLIACNVNKVKDYNGKYQYPKFLTLTFKDNITDIEGASKEFIKFNKRLSYEIFKVKKNVLKYVCVPEFQKRGAIHYHIIYFNLPYIEFEKLLDIWGNGGVYIEAIKDNDKKEIENIAKYVCKYIAKENSLKEDNYYIYLEKGLINKRRYYPSRGLNKPVNYKLLLELEQQQYIDEILCNYNTYSCKYNQEFLNDLGEKVIKNEIIVNVYELDDVKVKSLKKLLNSLEKHSQYVKFNQKVKVDARLFDDFYKYQNNLI